MSGRRTEGNRVNCRGERTFGLCCFLMVQFKLQSLISPGQQSTLRQEKCQNRLYCHSGRRDNELGPRFTTWWRQVFDLPGSPNWEVENLPPLPSLQPRKP